MWACGDSLACMETFEDLLSPVGTSSGLWAPMESYQDL